MTLKQFLEKLEQTPRDWEIKISGEIRNRRGMCPIVAVHGKGFGGDEYIAAADQMGLSKRNAVAIARAADAYEWGPLRKRLLQACGLPRGIKMRDKLTHRVITVAAELLRGTIEGKTFRGPYFRAATLAIEALRDGDRDRAAIYLAYAREEK